VSDDTEKPANTTEMQSTNSIEKSGEGGQTLTEELTEAFEFYDSIELFKASVQGVSDEAVRDAITLLPSQPLRSQFTQWYELLADEGACTIDGGAVSEEATSESDSALSVGTRLRRFSSYLGKVVFVQIKGIVDGLAELSDGCYESLEGLRASYEVC
jgi:hypothetical protein